MLLYPVEFRSGSAEGFADFFFFAENQEPQMIQCSRIYFHFSKLTLSLYPQQEAKISEISQKKPYHHYGKLSLDNQRFSVNN